MPLQQLLDHWAANPRQVMIPMIDIDLFAIATAMRLGEIVSLEWSDLDELNRTILIRARKHPTRKATNDQRVPLLRGPCAVAGKLIDPLEIILRQKSAWSRTGRIFPHAAQSISTTFQRTTDALEIPDLHFHDLLHDGASRLFEGGYSIEQVALMTGHRDWNMLRRYTQLRAQNLHRIEPAVPHGPTAPRGSLGLRIPRQRPQRSLVPRRCRMTACAGALCQPTSNCFMPQCIDQSFTQNDFTRPHRSPKSPALIRRIGL
jgi:site-specific recombinase XerC